MRSASVSIFKPAVDSARAGDPFSVTGPIAAVRGEIGGDGKDMAEILSRNRHISGFSYMNTCRCLREIETRALMSSRLRFAQLCGI